MSRLNSIEAAEALRIARHDHVDELHGVDARSPHETLAAALLDALDSVRILTERVEDAERRRLDLAGLCAQESSRADRTERDFECARSEVKRLNSEAIDGHCAHRTAMDNGSRDGDVLHVCPAPLAGETLVLTPSELALITHLRAAGARYSVRVVPTISNDALFAEVRSEVEREEHGLDAAMSCSVFCDAADNAYDAGRDAVLRAVALGIIALRAIDHEAKRDGE